MSTIESKLLKIRAWGPFALFTRPEFKVERVTYDVITPTAARGLFESVLWHPGMRWNIKRIHVLKPVRLISLKRNEVKNGRVQFDSPYMVNEDRTQRTSLALQDVDYVIEATISLTEKATPGDNLIKFTEMFERRRDAGQFFRSPYFGCREFAAYIEPAPSSFQAITLDKDLGRIPVDVSFENGIGTYSFAAAALLGGVLEVPAG